MEGPLSESEFSLLSSCLNDKRHELKQHISSHIRSLEGYMEKILYYDGLIEVDWCEAAHNVYQKNKEEYLSHAHKWYEVYLGYLKTDQDQLNQVDLLLEKISKLHYGW